ncbi:MAG: hypothetical protein A2252_05240 [Elusimicrobia bacterium RIFOXYA2_FULL_39_19]|nr:MAG: hypothetical protein A2252_05240 [Elusimicrobia bacterium RIFOXYA2_FULL_39_19]
MAKILIVEDDKDIVEVLSIALEKRGFEIAVAYDGQEALEKSVAQKPDLILLDLMIPKIDGHSVNIRLKENPETALIPVIVVTGRGNLKELLNIQEGVSVAGYFEKPVTIKLIIQKIEELIKK